jgi:hypothetical protein
VKCSAENRGVCSEYVRQRHPWIQKRAGAAKKFYLSAVQRDILTDMNFISVQKLQVISASAAMPREAIGYVRPPAAVLANSEHTGRRAPVDKAPAAGKTPAATPYKSARVEVQ